jgi:deoxyribose-phosphate aldolase
MNPTASVPLSEQQMEQLIEAVAAEIFSYLGERQYSKLRGLGIEEVVCPGCDARCVETCADKARRVMAAGADRLSAGPGIQQLEAELARLIDHTLLRPEASRDDIRKLCGEAKQFGFAAVVVNPYWVPLAAAELHGTPVKVCTVVGFPFGATLPGVKTYETEQVLKLGAQEVDMVMNIGALKSGEDDLVEEEIRGVGDACHGAGALCKVILETAVLSDEEKVRACERAKAAGADFVKTSTGFGPGGATARDVELMRLVVGPEMGVKAAGGIRTLEDLRKMMSAGATRIGASASVKILQEAAGAPPALVPAEAAAAGSRY